MDAIETREIDGTGIIAESLLARQVEVVLEVGDGKLAKSAVDGFAEAETAVVGLSNSSPTAVLLEDGEHVVVVAHGFEIEEQGRMALDSESGRGQERAFKAVADPVAQDAAGRADGFAVGFLVVGDVDIEEALDFVGSLEGLEDAQFTGIEAVGGNGHQLAFRGLRFRFMEMRLCQASVSDGETVERMQGVGARMGRMKKAEWIVGAASLLLAAGVARLTGQESSAVTKTGGAQQLVVLDTDIGDDIDDAFALALVLRSPELKLLGVTTAFGDTELRARLVDRYLAAVGRGNIPVAAGVRTAEANHLSQAAYALQAPARKYADGVEFLLSQIRIHPGEVTLIAIGPLFNVQAAIERDPATFKKLKRVVIMGGSVYRGYDTNGDTHQPPSAEWNIRCDPAGARALLGAGVPVFVMPLDSTQVHLENPELGMVFAHGSTLTDQLTLLYHQWAGQQGAGNKGWRSPTLYDPVAVTYAIHPELCPATPMRLEVDEAGLTKPVAGEPNAEVCLHSDEKGFLDLLVARITGDTTQ